MVRWSRQEGRQGSRRTAFGNWPGATRNFIVLKAVVSCRGKGPTAMAPDSPERWGCEEQWRSRAVARRKCGREFRDT